MKTFLKIVILVINLLFAGLLLLAGSATLVSPEKFILPAYLGLFFLPLVVINLLFLLFWVVKLKWYFVFSLVVLALSYTNIRNDFPLNSSKRNSLESADTTQEISLLSYNVKLFDFYKKDKTLAHGNKTLNYIIERDADIVCLQEFGYYNERRFLSEEEITTAFREKYPYHHIAYHENSTQKSTYGVATFSKFPIVNKGDVDYNSKYNHTIFSDIKIGEHRLRLFNCHLESNQLTLDDKKRMVELVDSTSRHKLSETTEALTRKLGPAYRKRAQQADMVADAVRDSPHPVVVCGDFNDTPISYTYKTIRGDLDDVFVDCSSGLGITYNELPFLYRIDYLMYSDDLVAEKFKIDRQKLSDHYPVSCVFKLKN